MVVDMQNEIVFDMSTFSERAKVCIESAKIAQHERIKQQIKIQNELSRQKKTNKDGSPR